MGADATAAASREAADVSAEASAPSLVSGDGGACDAAIGTGACAGGCGANGATCGGPFCGGAPCGGAPRGGAPCCDGGGAPCGGAPRGGAICGGPFCGGAPCASGATTAATFEPGDATSCFASHASLAPSSLDSAEHAYSVPSLHISAIEISSAPHAGASSSSSDVAAAAAAFGAALGASSCLERCTALPPSEGGDADCGAAAFPTSESRDAAPCFASHASTWLGLGLRLGLR